MDKTDIILSMLLMQNSRQSYSELAEKLCLSVNAVHKRIQALKELGVIKRFTARIGAHALKTIHVMIFGESEAEHIEEEAKKLQGNDSIYWVGISGGNHIHVAAHLHDISRLDTYVDFVRKQARMPTPTVGIIPEEELPVAVIERGFQNLDYKIIYALRNDSRRPIPEIAEEIGVSAKTVRRRLSTMIHDGLIELSLEWYPDKSNDIWTLIHVHLKTSADKAKVCSLLTKEYAPHLIIFQTFSNLPNRVLLWVWTNTLKELQGINRRLQNEESIEKVVPYVLFIGYIFDTWRDKLAIEKGVADH